MRLVAECVAALHPIETGVAQAHADTPKGDCLFKVQRVLCRLGVALPMSCLRRVSEQLALGLNAFLSGARAQPPHAAAQNAV
ncbi:hypothetical protein IA54_009065 [Xanthomonas phaseoli pv. syngonii LMG 9055]|uniref:Uncharacterized protein n=1 Tax=Xanthomonas phaseoli pv. syngonii LMG 9055 TaxID=1437878 RepID=A0A1V9H101_9XANT|nr:hypothetical protein IA54_009065 [Xanthomonas phaseoli pv. syngonii LMG 9055]